jgi:tRNA (cmo5U34)-methyltransferase
MYNTVLAIEHSAKKFSLTTFISFRQENVHLPVNESIIKVKQIPNGVSFMTIDSEPFEVNRWHSPEYVESWMANQSRETERQFLRKKLVSLLPFEPDASIRVLDIGAGTGCLSLEVLGAYSKAQITCHDFSDTMLTHARQQLLQFSDKVTFVKSDLQDPEWTKVVEGEFDAVVSSLVFYTVPDRIPEIDSEVFPLVKAGGCFMICDNIAPPGPMIEKVYFKSRLIAYQGIIKAETGIEKNLANVEQELREQRRLREDSFPHRIRNTSIKAINLMNQLDWLKQAGFDEVDCLWKEMRRAIISGFKHAK